MESEEMLAGGLTEPRPATPEIQEIANKVKPQLEEKTNKTYEKFEAIIYRSQVVAGTNYYIKVHVGGNNYVHIRVFQSLPHQEDPLKLIGYQVDKTKDDELTGF
uniref:Leukocyte cysteine proteinase inhibitor 1 n=1 Tax=Sus scrofa TaxID=9823 RepID=CPI1_PIG|nr:RecName: Full=Leukocyte cysteine proteinase inhibitor 1; AltName: Full=PLCPI; AltName: Full=Stefin-D1 [Sus scrofa]AAB29392.1 PLCPI=cysteine proteinase inhibitor [swine, polymorphonuclear leukocytes, Peptide, 103 aa] [Sus scrofa]